MRKHMALFDGNPRRPRKINLGGNRHQSSRDDVFKQVEQQRARREGLRRSTAAALTLQSAWRRILAIRRSQRAIADQFFNGQGFSSDPLLVRPMISFFLPVLLRDEPRLLQTLNHLATFAATHTNNDPLSRLPLRLCLVWDTVLNADCCRAALKVLDHEPLEVHSWVPRITSSLLRFGIRMGLWDTIESNLLRLATLNSQGVVEALLTCGQDAIAHVPLDGVVEQIGSVADVNTILQKNPYIGSDAVVALLSRISSHTAVTLPLVQALLPHFHAATLADKSAKANSAQTTNLAPLYSRAAIRSVVDSPIYRQDPVSMANYFLALLALLPRARTEILLQLSLASSSSPSLVQFFWAAFARTPLCAAALAGPDALRQLGTWQDFLDDPAVSPLRMVQQMYSYWLLIATDDDVLMNASGRGLDRNELEALACVLRNLCFTCLWNWLDDTSNAGGLRTGLFALMRQVYTRDSRRQFLPTNFWLMENYISQVNLMVTAVDDETLFLANEGALGAAPEAPISNGGESDSDEDEDDDDVGTPVRVRRNKSPTLEILRQAPFFIAFTTRVRVLRAFINKDRDRLFSMRSIFDQEFRRHFDIRRENLVEDAQKVFEELGPRVKTELAVQFLSQGVPEAGIDGGGLTKEILTSVCAEVLCADESNSSPYTDLFMETDNHTLAPNPRFGERDWLKRPGSAEEVQQVQKRYVFMGQIVAKCLYENLLVDVEFAPFFLAKWAGASATRSSFDDLYLLDESLYTSLLQLYRMDGVDNLGLDFTTVGSHGQVVELRPDGAQIAVTDSNKLEYIRELANYKLNMRLGPQTRWFLEGMSKVISLNWLKMFNPPEIQTLVSGRMHDFDVDDLRANTEVHGFSADSPTIQNFWKVLRDMTPEQRGDFLKFVTSVPRAPLLGFRQLVPRFGIRCAGYDDKRLPTSSTCVNLLKLPEYSSPGLLKRKLLYSIESKAGFDLS